MIHDGHHALARYCVVGCFCGTLAILPTNTAAHPEYLGVTASSSDQPPPLETW